MADDADTLVPTVFRGNAVLDAPSSSADAGEAMIFSFLACYVGWFIDISPILTMMSEVRRTQIQRTNVEKTQPRERPGRHSHRELGNDRIPSALHPIRGLRRHRRMNSLRLRLCRATELRKSQASRTGFRLTTLLDRLKIPVDRERFAALPDFTDDRLGHP